MARSVENLVDAHEAPKQTAGETRNKRTGSAASKSLPRPLARSVENLADPHEARKPTLQRTSNKAGRSVENPKELYEFPPKVSSGHFKSSSTQPAPQAEGPENSANHNNWRRPSGLTEDDETGN